MSPGRSISLPARMAAAVLAAVLVGWLNYSATDDVQAVALALAVLGFTFAWLGWRPRWLYPLLLFLAIPASGLLAVALHHHPEHNQLANLYQSVVALIPLLLGVGAGLLTRKLQDVSSLDR